MTDDVKLDGNITLKVTTEKHAEIKAAASNEGESVTAYITNAINQRMAGPVSTPVVAKGKSKDTKPGVTEETQILTFSDFSEWLDNNWQDEKLCRPLAEVVKCFIKGVNLPTIDKTVRRA